MLLASRLVKSGEIAVATRLNEVCARVCMCVRLRFAKKSLPRREERGKQRVGGLEKRRILDARTCETRGFIKVIALLRRWRISWCVQFEGRVEKEFSCE